MSQASRDECVPSRCDLCASRSRYDTIEEERRKEVRRPIVMRRHVRACVGSLSVKGAPFLRRLRAGTLTSQIPVVQESVRDFVEVLLTLGRPGHVLRIKATMNFSALLVYRCKPRSVRVIAVRGCRGEVPITGSGFEHTKERSRVALLRKSTKRVLGGLAKAFSVVFVSTTGNRCVR